MVAGRSKTIMETNNQTTKSEKRASQGAVLLEKAYDLALNGIPTVSETLEDLVEPYLQRYATKVEAEGGVKYTRRMFNENCG